MVPARADTIANISAYCEQGTMADGHWTHWGAAGGAAWIPLGSLVWIQGYGTVIVEDRGAPGAYTLDLAMPGDCRAAWAWGRRYLKIQFWFW